MSESPSVTSAYVFPEFGSLASGSRYPTGCQRSETKPAAEIAVAESALRDKLEAIAREEMLRSRARLGLITQEQERALEHLLVSMVEKISNPIVERARLYYAEGEIEKARRWCSVFG